MSNNTLLNYRRQGTESEALPLVIIHGLLGSMDNLSPVSRYFAESREVISVDLRNHGRSFHDELMTYPAMANDVFQLLDSLNLKEVILLGHSMGGKVAMQMAVEAPERIKAVIAGDIAPVDYEHRHDAVLNALKDYQPELAQSRSEADAQFSRHINMPSVRQLLIKNLERKEHGFAWRINAPAIVANYDSVRSAPELANRTYNGPILFVKGGESDYLLTEHKTTISQHFPKASLKVMMGVGHWLHAEKPDIFNTVCQRFLAGHGL